MCKFFQVRVKPEQWGGMGVTNGREENGAIIRSRVTGFEFQLGQSKKFRLSWGLHIDERCRAIEKNDTGISIVPSTKCTKFSQINFLLIIRFWVETSWIKVVSQLTTAPVYPTKFENVLSSHSPCQARQNIMKTIYRSSCFLIHVHLSNFFFLPPLFFCRQSEYVRTPLRYYFRAT